MNDASLSRGGLIPLQFFFRKTVQRLFYLTLLKLTEVHIRHQVILDILNCLIECFGKLEEIFFVEKYFVLVENEAVGSDAFFAFGDGDVIIVAAGGFDVKKVRPLAGSDALRVDFSVFFEFFHGPDTCLVGFQR